MIALYISIISILFAFYISRSINRKQKISQLGVCSICDNTFNDKDLIEQDSLSFCHTHFNSYKDNEWILSESVLCSVDNEEESVKLYHKKKNLFINGTLSYLKSSYRQDNEKIITVLDLYILKDK